jgi:VPS13, central RBG modules
LSSITTEHCPHLVLDAGHIAIESDLAAKDARKELDTKLNQSYDIEDYKRLESHMYDRFSLKFDAAQVRVISLSEPVLMRLMICIVFTRARP